MKHVTKEMAIATLKEIIEERGQDYAYDEHNDAGECVYVKDGHPSCLIGHALHSLGAPLEFLGQMDADGGEDARTVCVRLQDAGLMSFDGGPRNLFARAQSLQDNGEAWGAAVEEAVAYVARLTP